MRTQYTPVCRPDEEVQTMGRKDKLVIRLSTAERAAIDRLAQVERLPASTLVRSMLLREVDCRGLWSPPGDWAGRQTDHQAPETDRSPWDE
jgi:hypothetical protein